MEEINQRNADHPYIAAEKLEIKDARNVSENLVDDRPFKTFKLWASQKHAKLLMKRNEFYIELRRVHVTLWRPSERCSNCLDKGHKAANCQAKTACKHCGGEHVSYKCQQQRNSNIHHCVICHRANESHKHRAAEESCPILKKEIEEALSKTAVEIWANHG